MEERQADRAQQSTDTSVGRPELQEVKVSSQQSTDTLWGDQSFRKSKSAASRVDTLWGDQSFRKSKSAASRVQKRCGETRASGSQSQQPAEYRHAVGRPELQEVKVSSQQSTDTLWGDQSFRKSKSAASRVQKRCGETRASGSQSQQPAEYRNAVGRQELQEVKVSSQQSTDMLWGDKSFRKSNSAASRVQTRSGETRASGSESQ